MSYTNPNQEINLNDSERCIARCYSDNLGQTMHVNTGAEQNHD